MIDTRKALFPLGQVVATPGALEALEQAGQAPSEFLERHVHGDWGIVCEDDAELLELLNTEIRAVPGVTATETLVYLKLVKQQYNWGTR